MVDSFICSYSKAVSLRNLLMLLGNQKNKIPDHLGFACITVQLPVYHLKVHLIKTGAKAKADDYNSNREI